VRRHLSTARERANRRVAGMRDLALFADLARTCAQYVRDEAASLAVDERAWQPDPRGDAIGTALPHCTRAHDDVAD
jgi:hypothetical protein